MLSEMARQVLHAQSQIEELGDAGMSQIESGMAELVLHRVGWTAPLPRTYQCRKAIERLHIEAKRFTYFARGRTSPVSNHVCRHRRAMRAIFRVHVLNHALALIATRQIEVYVRHLAALVGKKAFEQQLHANRIDRSDTQRVTHSAVGRR